MAQVDEYCGFCGGKEEFKIFLYGPYCKRRNMVKKINYCLALNLSESGSQSKYICYKCVADVEKFYDFRILANKTFAERKAKSWYACELSDDEDSDFEDIHLSFMRKSGGGNNNCNKKAKSGSISDMFPSLLSVRPDTDRPLSLANLNLDGSKEKEENTRMALKDIHQAIMGADDLVDQNSSAKSNKRARSSKMNNGRPKTQQMSADLFETQSTSAYKFSESLKFSDWNIY